ncbi:unnamed protein product [Adineta steineri]|uniref:Amidase domain-containing protein n=1 Tax=Adineta steineri TaxID=433720 RepID=A0A818ZWN5_9BILA|nr:unnamed protein product [Adineta steineri]CAF3775565.1 unnamed protein product [Adineta steineri]
MYNINVLLLIFNVILFRTTNSYTILNSISISINSSQIFQSSCSTYSPIPLIDPITVDIKTLAEDLSACRYSSSDLVRWYLTRIDAVNRQGSHPLHAVIETNPDALEIANALDQERHINGSRSILHGIPILVKDNIATYDKMETTAGSLALFGSRVPRDAFVVQQLRKAGAIILGKASLSEWSNFKSENVTRAGWSARGGLTNSAYVANGDPYGSSSGSAVATSAGLCAAAIGTETAGSIVSPASRANIVGLKPTVGLTSRSGVIPISHDHDTVGPLGRTVEDVALLLEVIQGVDSRDNATQQQGIIRHQNYTQFLLGIEGLRNLRLGVIRQGINITDERQNRVNEAIQLMSIHGATIIDPVNITIADDDTITDDLQSLASFNFRDDIINYLSELKNTTIRSVKDIIKFNIEHADKEFHPEYSPNQNVFISIENKTNMTTNDYIKLYNKTRLIGGRDGIDAILTQHRLDGLIIPDVTHEITIFASFAGYPLIVVPLGFNKSNDEPYGLMFAGTAWSESMLLRIAHGFEQAFSVRNTVRPKYAEQYGYILQLLFKIIEFLKKLKLI